MKRSVLYITIASASDATVATAELGDVTLTASAKREPGDRPDAAIGQNLATARVLVKVARRLERGARGRIKHADDVKTARRAAKAARNRAILEEKLAPGAQATFSKLTEPPPRLKTARQGK